MSCLQRTLLVGKTDSMQAVMRHVSRQVFMADDVTEALEMVGRLQPDLVIIDLDQAEAFRRAGATNRLGRHTEVEGLRRIVAAVAPGAGVAPQSDEEAAFFVDPSLAKVPMVGRSLAVQEEFRLLRRVAQSRCNPVLITGETGTGKELAAQVIHQIRGAGRPFVAVNCAALTANLLESELFGHVKGAFTGADREKTGLFELAGSGTLLLDEVSEMPVDLQAKLLRVLQERAFRKVGGVQEIPCQATIIASSNRPLKGEVQGNRFRRDLYYRLSVCPISLAPLRSPRRRDDIPILAEYFLRTSTICPEKQGRITALTRLAVEGLQRHDWPGNIRELRNVIDRAIMLEETNKIGLSSIVMDAEAMESAEQGGLVSARLKDFSLAKAERELIAQALKETGWQKTQAASLLGITRATLYAKVKQYNIERDQCGCTSYKRPAEAPIPEPVGA